MIVLVAGGTGFVGSAISKELERQGHQVIAHHRGYHAVPTYADAIINCVGIIRESSIQDFQGAHVEKTKWLLKLGKKLKVRQFVQISALGVDKGDTPYQRTKLQAERLVVNSGLPYAIIRPSMIFGPGDRSVNRFRSIARTGFLPLFGNGKVQPVSVDTVAKMAVAAVGRRVRDRIVELGGPEIFTYKELADRIHPGVRACRLPGFLRWPIAQLGRVITALPTPDMVRMLDQDVTTKDATVIRLRIQNPRLR